EETFNQIAGRDVDISAEFFALELSYDFDYIRYRASFAYVSGDRNPTDGRATGFDTIFDNPNFAGGGDNFFTRQAIALTGAGVDLTPKLKLITNASYLQFMDTSSMRFLLQDDKIGKDIGFDLSAALEYRPLLNNNIILTAGVAALIPGEGFKDIYTSETL